MYKKFSIFANKKIVMSKVKYISIMICMFIVLLFITSLFNSNNKKSIEEWCKNKHTTLISANMQVLHYGPFYYCNKGQYIYKIEVDNKGKKEIWWMRTGFFSNEYIKDNGK